MTYTWVSERGKGFGPLDFENFSNKRLFSYFLSGKNQNSPLFWLSSFLEKSDIAPTWKKFF